MVDSTIRKIMKNQADCFFETPFFIKPDVFYGTFKIRDFSQVFQAFSVDFATFEGSLKWARHHKKGGFKKTIYLIFHDEHDGHLKNMEIGHFVDF